MRFFKLPLIVSGITLLLAVLFGIGVVTWIHRAHLSDEQKIQRAQKWGAATAVATLLIIAPFWFVAATRHGNARRQAQASQPPAESGE